MIWIAIRGILRYLWMGPCHWTATALSYIIVPFIVPLASEDGWLPKWLSWFQTLDCSLDGDTGWQTEHRPFINPFVNTNYLSLTKTQRYICRVLWLYRNPVYGLEKTVLCAEVDPGAKRHVTGKTGIGDRWSTPPYQTGCNFTAIKNSKGKCYFQLGWFIKLTSKRSFNGMIGWKLLHAAWPRTDNYYAQICTTARSTKIFT